MASVPDVIVIDDSGDSEEEEVDATLSVTVRMAASTRRQTFDDEDEVTVASPALRSNAAVGSTRSSRRMSRGRRIVDSDEEDGNTKLPASPLYIPAPPLDKKDNRTSLQSTVNPFVQQTNEHDYAEEKETVEDRTRRLRDEHDYAEEKETVEDRTRRLREEHDAERDKWVKNFGGSKQSRTNKRHLEVDSDRAKKASKKARTEFHGHPFSHHPVEPPTVTSSPSLFSWQQQLSLWQATEDARLAYERTSTAQRVGGSSDIVSAPPATIADDARQASSEQTLPTLRSLLVRGDYSILTADGSREWRSHTTDRRQPAPRPPSSRRYPVLQGHRPAAWPFAIVHLAENYNPQAISFPYVSHYGSCGCRSPCRIHTCRNGQLGIFCTPACCPYDGQCGNGIEQSPCVQLMRHRGTNQLRVVAIEPIDEGVVIGQYLGELSLVSTNPESLERNEGYRLYLKRDDRWRKNRLCINAIRFGSLMRFLDHSCNPNTHFHQVCNGSRHTIVVATCRPIQAGEVITVYYGDELWFDCECGECSEDEDDGFSDADKCE